MTNEEIAKIYTEGNNTSHTHALRAVYDAGRNHDKYEADKATEATRVRAEKKETERLAAESRGEVWVDKDAARESKRLAALERGQVVLEEAPVFAPNAPPVVPVRP